MEKRARKSTRIQDSIHGIVELSDLERYIIDSLPFQRLLNIKQLGMAYSVFPGADYSRFSHCIGVSSIMARWLDTLSRKGAGIDEPKKRLYRLAALLHDIGHYPYSHTLEHAVADYYAETSGHVGVFEKNYLDHEQIGQLIVGRDQELNGALVEIGLNLQTLQNIFARQDSTKLDPLLSSDLDADRIDYLRRTAYHTGLPYGLVDIQYLITEITVDDLGRVCWEERALRALDQMLIARFFDYQQVVYNKTVIALEEVLSRIVRYMLSAGPDVGIDLSRDSVNRMLQSQQWIDFDDHFMFQKIKAFRDSSEDTSCVALCNSLLTRNPPRQVFQDESVGPSSDRKRYMAWVDALRSRIAKWSAAFDIHPELWFVWHKAFKFVDYSLDQEISLQDVEMEELVKLPRIKYRDRGASVPLICHPSSLMRSYYLTRAYTTKIFVVLRPEDADSELRLRIAERVGEDARETRNSFLERTNQTTIFDIA